ncbi:MULTISPECIES: DUF2505 domain-containing protein [unclassified Mycobacterium]|uniref:DUF2505 domain-containing protein n=1 Tax=unclassified Mycobacterium TaxID=2642494 RepID=UPI000A5CE4F0|nr:MULTISPECIES: DUF2505 domain-containing protein [unclassified Mycobacterium]
MDSSASVEQILSAFSEEEYWLARLAAFGGIGRLESLDVDSGGSVCVVIRTDLRHDGLPGPIAHLFPHSWHTIHKERWRPIREGQVQGEISVVTHGAPGSGTGTGLLIPTPQGTRLEGAATVEFRVPLIGGKVEKMIGRQLVEGLSATLNFTAEWVTEHN